MEVLSFEIKMNRVKKKLQAFLHCNYQRFITLYSLNSQGDIVIPYLTQKWHLLFPFPLVCPPYGAEYSGRKRMKRFYSEII